jgi:TRAP transporter TAXI family solute receptor
LPGRKEERPGSSGFILIVLISVLILFPLSALAQKAPDSKPGSPYKIDIYTFQVGTSTYAFGVAQAQLINAQSTWLKATALEIASATTVARMIIEEPSERKKIIGFLPVDDVYAGYPPFDKFRPPYEDILNIAAYGSNFNAWVTLDSKIKTLADFSGKTLGFGTSPSAARVDIPRDTLLASGATNIKVAQYDFTGGVRALKDGLIQGLLVSGFISDVATKKHIPNPAFAELLSTAKVYFVSYKEGIYDSISLKLKRRKSEYVVPPGMMSPMQTEPWRVAGYPIGWSCDRAVPDHVVYEFTRIMGENIHKFGDFHITGKVLNRELMPRFGFPREKMHPGALKYYDEKGLAGGIGKIWID